MRGPELLVVLVYLAPVMALAQPKRILAAPEARAGRWESPANRHGAVGMNLLVTTWIEGKASPSQHEYEVTAGFFRRSGPELDPDEFNYFSTGAGGGMSWDGHRLAVHSPILNTDLLWDEKTQQWNGLFERGAFRERVSLRRPSSTASPFAGTWLDAGGGLMNNCLHIAQQQDGGLAAWSDDIQKPGQVGYANGIQPPAQLFEHYGEIAKAQPDGPRQIKVELRAHTPICCSHPFSATLSADGQSMSGSWRSGPNQVGRAVAWRKLRGTSCMDLE